MAGINHAFLAPTRAEASKGLWPHEHGIARHTVLYRFVDLTRAAPGAAADGPWWFEFEHFQTIKHFAERHGYSFGYAARLFAAILYEWSEVNGVVRARAKADLSVWKGKGKQVEASEADPRDRNRTPHGLVTGRPQARSSRMTPMQGMLEVYQVYVPGLGRPHNQFAAYFDLLSCQPIATG